jgi:hypothetical protein
MRRTRWLALALIAPALAACGGDDEGSSSSEVKAPPMTTPGESTEMAPATGQTDSTETSPADESGSDGSTTGPMDQPNPGNGGVPAPDSNNPPPPSPPDEDSPSNDTPPEPGSPAERFEQFCAQNPGAC